ncbi:MAG TPA: DUF2510 domain-containing protein [Acidimicrobiales bacterium]|nr:DUF2510 domain-containing protein [Acidimicrobiales bacterium]
MSTTGTKPPGWYSDPDDPGLIRYWNGVGWTDERRPRPSWAPPLDPEEAARHEEAVRRRRKWWARGVGSLLVGVLLVATLFAVRGDVPAVPARTVEDRAFTDAANALCAEAMPAIRRQPPQPGDRGDRPSAGERLARRVEGTADDLQALVIELRRLPVADPDRPQVERWLDDWDEFIGIGHRYADALRTARSAEYTRVAAEGDAPSRRIYAFAKANGMPDCVFETR